MQDDSTKTAPSGTQTLLRGLAVIHAVANGARDLKDIAQAIGTTRSTPIGWQVVWWMNATFGCCPKLATCWAPS